MRGVFVSATARSWRSPYEMPLPAASGSKEPRSMPARMDRAARWNGSAAFSPVSDDVSMNVRSGVSFPHISKLVGMGLKGSDP